MLTATRRILDTNAAPSLPVTTHTEPLANQVALARETATDERIAALRDEAATAGDMDMVDMCTDALNGDGLAIIGCATSLHDAAAA